MTPLRRLLLTSLLALAAALAPMPLFATEEPAYQVVRPLGDAGDMELRAYPGYAVAEVVVPGPADEAGGQAFPILARYIFGGNRGERRLEMTAPVTQAPAPASSSSSASASASASTSVMLDMTAPVTQAATSNGFLVQFVLPRGVTAATAPVPLDARVHVRDVPAREVAVIRYSGFWSASNDREHLARLQATLQAAGLAWSGEPVLARYNPPFTPWFLRRNEIWLARGQQ